MFCAECGAAVGPLDQVCSVCGSKLEQEKSVPAPQKLGLGVLSKTRTILNALSEGKVIRSSIAVVLQVAAALVLLAGLFALIQILKYSFQFPSATATVGGVIVAVLLAAAAFAVSQIYLFRAHSIRELEDSPFTIIPILSILLRAVGETYAVGALAAGLGGCLFTWFSCMSPGALLSGLGGLIPGIPAGGGSFLDGLLFLATLAGAAFAFLIVSYALAELVVVVMNVAINVRRMSKPDTSLSS